MKKLWIGVLCAGAVFGATGACPSGVSNVAVSNGVTTPVVPIPGAGPGNDFTTLGSIGCSAVDLTFSNFTGTFAGTGTANNVLTPDGTYFTVSNVGSFDPLATPTGVVLSTARGTASVNTDIDNNDGVNNWISTSSSAGKTVADALSFVTTSASLAVSAVQITVNQPVTSTASGHTGAGTITFDLCLGGTATGVVTSAASCTGGGTFFTQVVTLTTATTQLATLTLPFSSSRIDFTAVVNLSGFGTATGGFDSLGLGFDEVAPEPSTFILMGTALAGLGLLRFRKRR